MLCILQPRSSPRQSFIREIVIATNCRAPLIKASRYYYFSLFTQMRRLPQQLIFPARNSKRERRHSGGGVVQHLRYSNQFGTVCVCCVLCRRAAFVFRSRRKRAIWYFPPGSIWHESLAIDRERWVEWFDFSLMAQTPNESLCRGCRPKKETKKEENKKCGVDVLVSFRGVAPRYLLEVTIATAQLHTHTHAHTEERDRRKESRDIFMKIENKDYGDSFFHYAWITMLVIGRTPSGQISPSENVLIPPIGKYRSPEPSHRRDIL